MDQEQDQNEVNDVKDHCLFPKFQKNLIEEFISNSMGKDIQINKGFKDKFNKSLVLFNLYLVHVYIYIIINQKQVQNINMDKSGKKSQKKIFWRLSNQCSQMRLLINYKKILFLKVQRKKLLQIEILLFLIMYEQLSIKVRIHLKDIDVSFFIKLHQGTTFRNILEIIYEGQFYENFNKSEYCALFYGDKYIQDREAQIIVNFQLKYNEQKSQLVSQNFDCDTLDFVRNQDFTNRKQTSMEANNTRDEFYQQKQSEIRRNQGAKRDDQFKIQYGQQDQEYTQGDINQQNAHFLPDKPQDLGKLLNIENNNQPQYDQSDIQINENLQSQLIKKQNDNLDQIRQSDRVHSQSVIKPQEQLLNRQQNNINQDELDIHKAQLIQTSQFIYETQLRLIRFVSLNSLRVDLDDFESIRTVHLIGYENYNLNQIREFILREFKLQGKVILIKFNENDDIDQSTILRINKNYIRLYVHEKQLKKYQIQYDFNFKNDNYQIAFNEILPVGLEIGQLNKQYNIQNQQLRINNDKIHFGTESNSRLVKQQSFIFQYQSLSIFKYDLKYFSNSNQDPSLIFEEFFRCKFNYTRDKNNYVIDI